MTADQAREHMGRAVEAFRRQEYQHAADLFAEFFVEPVALDGINEMHWNYALCLAHLDQMPLALQHVQAGGYTEADFRDACRQSNIRDARADFDAADQLYRAERYQEACDAFAALLLHPGYPADDVRVMHWNIAMCFAHLGNFETALAHVHAGQWTEADFREAVRASNLRDARHDFDHAVELYRNGRYSEASDAFAELLLHPGYPAEDVATMHWNLAMCSAHLDQWDNALAHVRAGHHDEAAFRRDCEQHGLHPPAA